MPFERLVKGYFILPPEQQTKGCNIIKVTTSKLKYFRTTPEQQTKGCNIIKVTTSKLKQLKQV